jgi:glycosyltransferase 2 family protein
MKFKSGFLLKLFFTVTITVLLLRHLDPREAWSNLNNVEFPYLVAVFLIVHIDRIFMALKWRILLKAKSLDPPFPSLIKGYYVSGFLGPVLPTTIGDDLVRGVAVSDMEIGSDHIFSSIVVERILGVLSLLLVAIVSLSLFAYSRHNDFGNLLVGMSLFLIVSTVGFFYSLERTISPMGTPAIPSRQSGRIVRFLRKIRISYSGYRSCKKHLSAFFVLTTIEHLVIVYSNYLIIRSLGFPVSFLDAFYTVPSIMLLSRLPISIGRIGVQEGAYVMLLALVGLSLTDSITVSLVKRAIQFLSLLPAFLIILATGRAKRVHPIPE